MNCSAPQWSISASSAIFLLVTGILSSAQHGGGPKPALDPAQGDGGVSDFYVWDKPVPHTPGQLLRQEPLPEKLVLASASRSIRVLYSSVDGLDGRTPIAVSGAVYLPKGAEPAGGWPIIAWAHGTTGVADACAPSWGPRAQRDTDYLNAWLAQGYAVVATDYQGLGTPGPHPWLMVKPEARSVLDAVQAALKAFPELANSVVIVGQSQGAHAALSAALLAHDYAPNVKLKGTVATGVPSRDGFLPETKAAVIPVPQRTGGGLNAALTVLTLYSFMAMDPAFEPEEYLSDAAKPAFELGRTACLDGMIPAALQNKVTVENALTKSPDENALKPYQQYPAPRFAQPVFIGTGLADKTVLPEGQYNFVMAACYVGSTVESHYYPGKDHGGTETASLVDSVPFVKKVFAGEMIAGNCANVKPPISEK
jgi:pimeloyl-ACP methyl ester carboxylesterase